MSRLKFIMHMCPNCRKTYFFPYFQSINTKMNPELKELVMNGAIFATNCQECGYPEFLVHPFVYCAEDKGFIVNLNNYANLMDTYEDDKLVRRLARKYDEEFKTVGVTCYSDLVTTITAFENNLDWRVVKLALLYMEYDFIKFYTNKNMKYPDIKFSGLTGEKYDNGDLKMFVEIGDGDKTDRYDSPFPMSVYNKCLKEYKDRLDLINPFVFDKNMRDHFCLFFEEDFKTQEEHKSVYAYVKIDDENVLMCRPSPSLSITKMNRGDVVKIKKMNNETVNGTIKRFVRWNFLKVSIPKGEFGLIEEVISSKKPDIKKAQA